MVFTAHAAHRKAALVLLLLACVLLPFRAWAHGLMSNDVSSHATAATHCHESAESHALVDPKHSSVAESAACELCAFCHGAVGSGDALVLTVPAWQAGSMASAGHSHPPNVVDLAGPFKPPRV